MEEKWKERKIDEGKEEEREEAEKLGDFVALKVHLGSRHSTAGRRDNGFVNEEAQWLTDTMKHHESTMTDLCQRS